MQTSAAPVRASNLYFLQVNDTNSGLRETTPFHLLINDLNHRNDQCIIPIIQTKLDKELKLCIDACDTAHKTMNYGSIVCSTDFTHVSYESTIPSTLQVDTQLIIPTTSAECKSSNTKPANTLVKDSSKEIESNIKTKYGRHTPEQHHFDAVVNDSDYSLKDSDYKEDSDLTEVSSDGIEATETNPYAQTKRQSREIVENGRTINRGNWKMHIPDCIVPPRAVAVLPTVLQIRRDCISPRRLLPARVLFGPVQGVNHKISPLLANKWISAAAMSNKPIFLLRNEESIVHVDVSDKDKSNWLSLLPLGDQSTANVWLNEEDGELYGVTTKSIAPRTPLALGYSKKYAEAHRLPPGQPILDLHEAFSLKPKQWWCTECHRGMASAALLQRHMDVHKRDEKPRLRRRYRCSQCSRTFSRLFSLKRHTLGFCTKKTEKTENSLTTEPVINQDLGVTTQSVEGNRLPSDESLQNYTNCLDFSTNLFDPDRINNLDISGSSRYEIEFNPYNHDTSSANDVFFNGPLNASHYSNLNEIHSKPKSDQNILTSCPHCEQTIVKTKKRQHLRTCPARRLECECGLVFYKKQKLAEHIHSEHLPDQQSGIYQPKQQQLNEAEYKCELCKHTFKRRGMLVNHLWRVHNAPPAAVPLERRVRHYPCVACPKIYCAAAKRDRHVRNHHPGSELIRAAPIEGVRRACAPAACSACPRQYATRAKLLQHVRAQHPHLAEPKRIPMHAKLKTVKNMSSTSTSSPSQRQQTLGFSQ